MTQHWATPRHVLAAHIIAFRLFPAPRPHAALIGSRRYHSFPALCPPPCVSQRLRTEIRLAVEPIETRWTRSVEFFPPWIQVSTNVFSHLTVTDLKWGSFCWNHILCCVKAAFKNKKPKKRFENIALRVHVSVMRGSPPEERRSRQRQSPSPHLPYGKPCVSLFQ